MNFSNININLNKYIPNLDINIHTIKYIIFYFCIVLIVSCLLFIICTYFIIKFLNIHVDDYNILFYDYNSKCKKILQLYGDCKINKIYLTRQPLSKTFRFLLNMISLYKYEKNIIDTNIISLCHNGIIFEISLPNGKEKLLFLEKTNSINICDNFVINNNHELKRMKIKKGKYSINSILNETQKRVGNNIFFNWQIYKNNCKVFIKEIIKTIGKYNKSNKDFIFYDVNMDKIEKIITPTEFTKHIVNSLINIFNICEKYIYDSNLLHFL